MAASTQNIEEVEVICKILRINDLAVQNELPDSPILGIMANCLKLTIDYDFNIHAWQLLWKGTCMRLERKEIEIFSRGLTDVRQQAGRG